MATPDYAVPSGQPAPLLAPERTVSLPPSPHLGFDDVPAPGSARVRLAVGWVLSGLVLVFAFFAASFAARNSDLWLHLATGRLIAQGQYQIGVDPFAYTTDKVEWINHSWLFDWSLYLLYNGVGGVGLVLLKAIVVTLLAGILLSVRRPNADIAWPAACATFAILVMSPRLQLQPACVSYLFLGITLWLLWKPQADPGSAGNRTARGGLKYYVLLPLLCALWVNVDAWFLLGPLLIALFWAGERLEGLLRGSARDATPVTPWWVLPASVAACLLNPHHFRAFTLPAELSAALTETGLQSDPRFSRFFVSPWQLGIHWQPAAAINLAEWAYFLLVVLGLASFGFNWKSLSGWRLLVWVVFGLLGAWQIRATPFFAVVAGPITALNMQDFWSRLFSASRSMSGREPVAWPLARLASASAGLAPLVVLAWAGWLQGFQRAERKVAWEVQPDPSLQRVAETIGRWRQEGRLGEGDRAFPVHPDVAHYLAWYCPKVKGFLDSRFSLFHGATAEYEEVCRGLNPALDRDAGRMTAAEDSERPAGGWRQVLHKYGVTYLILYDPDMQRLLSATSALARDPDHWTLLRIDGQAMVYEWNEGRGEPSGDPFAALRFDPERLAFGLGEAEQEWPAAPGQGPGRDPQVRDLRTALVEPAPHPTWESPAATLLLHHFKDTAKARHEKEWARGWTGFAPGLAGIAAAPAKPAGAPADVLMRLRNAPLFFADSEQLPALPLLTVRAARRALALDPDDANAHLRLGQAYLTLQDAGGGGSLESRFPPLAMVRHIQTVTALEQTLLLNPDLEVVHEALAAIYQRRQYFDIALEHRRAELRLTRRAGPRPGESADNFARRVAGLEKATQDLEDTVQDRQNQFAIRSQGLSSAPLVKAEMALDLGLTRQALDGVLLPSNVVLFDTPGARLELTLLLMLGRAEEARAKLNDEELQAVKKKLGSFEIPTFDSTGRPLVFRVSTYEWLRACQAAATGDYDQAATALADARAQLRAEEASSLLRFQRGVSIAVTTELGLMARPDTLVFQLLMRNNREVLAKTYPAIQFLRAEQADLDVVAGVLALEQGLPAEAERRFKDALELCPSDGEPAVDFAGRPLAEAQTPRFRPGRE
jgi:hypothetical protein